MAQVFRKYACTALMLLPFAAIAQLNIESGAEVTITNNVLLTLQNTDLISNSTINQLAGTTNLYFTGSNNNTISGDELNLNNIQLAKTGLAKVLLNSNVTIADSVSFYSGMLDLNGHNLLLQPNALFKGENENSYATGTSGGYIQIVNALDAPSAANPGNLGFFITTSQNLGATTIRRGHVSQTNADGFGSSVLRYFDVIPQANTGLNAAVRFDYLDHELNGLTKSNLVLLLNADGEHWINEGATTSNTANDYVVKDGINSFGRFTLSSQGNVLPVVFTDVTATCIKNTAMISWHTQQELNSKSFVVESSSNGLAWNTLTTMPAAGQSSTLLAYQYQDNNPVAGQDLYRVVEYSLSGAQVYSSVVTAACAVDDNNVKIFPNPVNNILWLHINATTAADIIAEVDNNLGAKVMAMQYHLLPGANQFTVDVTRLAAGMYTVVVRYKDGEILKRVKVVKGF